ncbi:hypothetical protein [Tigheibacillus jepli]|uniref:hypothetical protein n=1 Tax=Tigheibacillus jepli TaxID=3035914 RepID=UPI00387E12C0
MNYKEEERVQVKKEFFRMMGNMQPDPAKQRLLYGFFESYLQLNDKEEEQLMEEIKHMDEADRIMEIPISYEEKGKEKGREEGREEGIKHCDAVFDQKIPILTQNKPFRKQQNGNVGFFQR